MTYSERREQAGLSLERLAVAAGISVPTVSRCMRENRLPQNRLAKSRFCKALGLDPVTGLPSGKVAGQHNVPVPRSGKPDRPDGEGENKSL